MKRLDPSLQVNANELTNGVINAAFMLLFKDSIRLFAAYNEGIINLLGKPSSQINVSSSVSSLSGDFRGIVLMNALSVEP